MDITGTNFQMEQSNIANMYIEKGCEKCPAKLECEYKFGKERQVNTITGALKHILHPLIKTEASDCSDYLIGWLQREIKYPITEFDLRVKNAYGYSIWTREPNSLTYKKNLDIVEEFLVIEWDDNMDHFKCHKYVKKPSCVNSYTYETYDLAVDDIDCLIFLEKRSELTEQREKGLI